ncbi:hypothetical protein A9Q84_00880 [Halobacteriovorax marinus]|uniref:Uncharacterized protein n=1 Tax=Halobacteriovorax marinus TaxID=97084 RepID=A0A1Y5FFS8_9BACT|nr:hypothetical protein A9Q84_00880 [Halobacteriovorax marinus]
MKTKYEHYIQEFENLNFKDSSVIYKDYSRWKVQRRMIHFTSSVVIVLLLTFSNSNIGTTTSFNVVDDNIYKVQLLGSDKFPSVQVILGEGLSFVSDKFPSVSELRELDFEVSLEGLSILVTSDSKGTKPILLKYYNSDKKYLIKKVYLNIKSL